MNSKIKSIIYFLLKIILFGLALFDFFYILSHIQSTLGNGTGITFYSYSAWYERSTADLWLLLMASICLLIGKRGTYVFGLFLSGIIIVKGLLIYCYRISLFEVWKYVRDLELNIWLQWEIQFFLAVIIFGATVFYLIRSELNMQMTNLRIEKENTFHTANWNK